MTFSTDEPEFESAFLERPNEFYLRQGDVIPDVPLIVPPPRTIAIGAPRRVEAELRATEIALPARGEACYGIVQLRVCDAIILTYDCDLDRGLAHIVQSGEPDAVELITVTGVIPCDESFVDKIPLIQRGRMPRFAYLPATTAIPASIVDFSMVQQVSLRVVLPIAYEGRRIGLTDVGQRRLLGRLAHSLGDVIRRMGADPEGDPTLFRRAYQAL